jgi:hypothetical protein
LIHSFGGGKVRKLFLQILLALTLPIVGLRLPACADESAVPQIREEIWALPIPNPILAYLVRPVGNGPFPLVIMNHGVSLDPRERSFFPLIEFRDAAFWLARRGHLVVAPIRPGYGAGALDIPERGYAADCDPDISSLRRCRSICSI